MPLKAAVLPLLDAASPVVETVGAANTVLLRDRRRVGENTDVPGMVAALTAAGIGAVEEAVRARRRRDRDGRRWRRWRRRAGRVRAYVRDPARRDGLVAAAAAAGVTLEVGAVGRAADGAGRPAGRQQRLPRERPTTLVASVPRHVGALFEVLYDPWPTTARGGLGRPRRRRSSTASTCSSTRPCSRCC